MPECRGSHFEGPEGVARKSPIHQKCINLLIFNYLTTVGSVCVFLICLLNWAWHILSYFKQCVTLCMNPHLFFCCYAMHADDKVTLFNTSMKKVESVKTGKFEEL